MEETAGHFAKLSQSDRQILYDLTYTWSEDKQNSEKQNRVARDTRVGRGEGGIVDQTDKRSVKRRLHSEALVNTMETDRK